jgi:hypothetical protein
MLSDGAGENPEAVLVGELECDEGVGRLFGDGAMGDWLMGSCFGAMLELDLRDW